MNSCGDVEAGATVAICECGSYRQADRPCGYTPALRRPSLSCPACCGTGRLDEGGQGRNGVRRTVACPLCCYVEAHRMTPAQRYALEAFRRNSGSRGRPSIVVRGKGIEPLHHF